MSKKVSKNLKAKNVLGIDDVCALAHDGTKEALALIKTYLKKEKDPAKLAEAQMALEECEFFYYTPMNKKEEEEFLLSELIMRKEIENDNYYIEIGKNEASLEEYRIAKKVHKKVLERNKEKSEEWKYNYFDDMVLSEKKQIEKLKDYIAYNDAWIKEAKSLIKTPRYKPCIPAEHLEHYDFNGLDDDKEGGESCEFCDCGE